ncbi:MAG TPA: hypothetical protein VEL47_03505 [Myxococcota bacterium]|nr:hypothetical protein [Myxococcota bacterium]
MDKKKVTGVESEGYVNPKKVGDWVKKTLLTGAGAVFMTEEGIRNALLELKMPKNVIAAAVAQADKTKREISTMIAKEVRHFLDRVKIEDIIQKALAGQSVEIKATITFVGERRKGKKKAVRNTAVAEKK